MSKKDDKDEIAQAEPLAVPVPMPEPKLPKPGKDPKTGLFMPGNSLGGRPKGARAKLSETLLKRLAEDFEVHGVEAIVKFRESDPGGYIKSIVSLVPKEITGEDGNPIEVRVTHEVQDFLSKLSAIADRRAEAENLIESE